VISARPQGVTGLLGGGNEIDVISGFTVAPGVPESATWVMVLAGFGALATAFGAGGRISTTS